MPCILYDVPCAALPSDVFSEISDAVSKTKSRKFSPSNQFRIKETKEKRERGGTLAGGGGQREGEESAFEMSAQQRLEMPRALPNTCATSPLAFF